MVLGIAKLLDQRKKTMNGIKRVARLVKSRLLMRVDNGTGKGLVWTCLVA